MSKDKLLAISFDETPEYTNLELDSDINVINHGSKYRSSGFTVNELLETEAKEAILDNFQTTFLFTGQGAQYFNMCKDLYENSETFKRHLLDAAAEVDKHLDLSILDVIYANEDNTLINQTGYTQPGLFVIEYALAKTWIDAGIKPDVLMGHSVGEYAAHVIAGVMPLSVGAELISWRAKLMQQLPEGGSMAAIMADYDTVKQYVAKVNLTHDHLDVAAVNGPKQVVVSGAADAVVQCVELATLDKIKARQLVVSHAFHSSLMDPMLDEFASIVSKHNFNKPNIDIISNLTGKVMQKAPDEDYWVSHVRQAVLFANGVECCVKQRPNIFIEVGPESILSNMALRCVDDKDGLYWLSSASRKKPNGRKFLLENFKQAFKFGMTLQTVNNF